LKNYGTKKFSMKIDEDGSGLIMIELPGLKEVLEYKFMGVEVNENEE